MLASSAACSVSEHCSLSTAHSPSATAGTTSVGTAGEATEGSVGGAGAVCMDTYVGDAVSSLANVKAFRIGQATTLH
jgi:hypothetical protein